MDSAVPPPKPEGTRPEAPVVPALTHALKTVPERAELQRVGKLFKEVYASALADRKPAARRVLAMRSVGDAPKAQSTPTDQFVLLAGARQASQGGTDLPLCVQAPESSRTCWGPGVSTSQPSRCAPACCARISTDG